MNTMKTFAVFIVLFFAFISNVNAHFRLVFPPPRGQSAGDNIYLPPCGGFDSVNTSATTDFPVKGGLAITYFGHGVGYAYFFYAPTSLNATFKIVSVDNITVDVPHDSPLNFETLIDLTKADAKVNDTGVLQAAFLSTEGAKTMYGCADIKITAENTTSPAVKKGSDANIVGVSSGFIFTIILSTLIMTLLNYF